MTTFDRLGALVGCGATRFTGFESGVDGREVAVNGRMGATLEVAGAFRIVWAALAALFGADDGWRG